MEKTEIKKRTLAVLEQFLKNPGELQAVIEGGPLLATSSFDSLSLVNFVVELENELGVRIDTDDITQTFDSIDSLTDYLAGLLSQQS